MLTEPDRDRDNPKTPQSVSSRFRRLLYEGNNNRKNSNNETMIRDISGLVFAASLLLLICLPSQLSTSPSPPSSPVGLAPTDPVAVSDENLVKAFCRAMNSKKDRIRCFSKYRMQKHGPERVICYQGICKTQCEITDTCFEDGPVCGMTAQVRRVVCDSLELAGQDCPADLQVVRFGPATFFCATYDKECVKAIPVCQRVAAAAAASAPDVPATDVSVPEVSSASLPAPDVPAASEASAPPVPEVDNERENAPDARISSAESQDDIRYQEDGVFLSHSGWNHVIQPLLDVIQEQRAQIGALNETIHHQETAMLLMRNTTLSLNATAHDLLNRAEEKEKKERMESTSLKKEEEVKSDAAAANENGSFDEIESSVTPEFVNQTIDSALKPFFSRVEDLDRKVDSEKMDNEQNGNEITDRVNALAEDAQSALRKADRAIYLANNSLNFSNNNKQDLKQLTKSAIADRGVAQDALNEANDLRKSMDEVETRTGEAFEAANEARNIANDAAQDSDAANLKAQEAKNTAINALARLNAVEDVVKETATTREVADLRRRQNEDREAMKAMNATVTKSAAEIENVQRTLPEKIKTVVAERVNNSLSTAMHSFNKEINAQSESLADLNARHIQLDKNYTQLGEMLGQHSTQESIRSDGFNARIDTLEKQQDGVVATASKAAQHAVDNGREIADMWRSVTAQNTSVSAYVDELSLKIDNSNKKLTNSSDHLERRLSKLEQFYSKMVGRANEKKDERKEGRGNDTAPMESSEVEMRSMESNGEAGDRERGEERMMTDEDSPAAFQNEWNQLERPTTPPSQQSTPRATTGSGMKRKLEHGDEEGESTTVAPALAPSPKRRPSQSEDDETTSERAVKGKAKTTSAVAKAQDGTDDDDANQLKKIAFGLLYVFGVLVTYTCFYSIAAAYGPAGRR